MSHLQDTIIRLVNRELDLIRRLQSAEAAFRGIATNATRCPACDRMRGLAERKEMEIRSFLGDDSNLKQMRKEWVSGA